MKGIYYDLHVHSCLSPCADDDMTPNNIVNMAMLTGLDAVALTDHNSCKNCAAASAAAAEAGMIFIPGMELETAEAIHVVCLFPTVEAAQRFSEAVYDYLPPITNRPDIYGNQIICDADDSEIGREERLLVNSTGIGIYEVPELCDRFGGISILAHIDRHSNGVLGVLGDISEDMGFALAETSPLGDADDYKVRFPFLSFIGDSDAHRLWEIQEPAERCFLAGDFSSAEDVIRFFRSMQKKYQ